jgi:hypothetical protein
MLSRETARTMITPQRNVLKGPGVFDKGLGFDLPRYGDVAPLLEGPDDRMVVIGSGDEDAPPVQRGGPARGSRRVEKRGIYSWTGTGSRICP